MDVDDKRGAAGPSPLNWREASVLVTGGTGSFGRKFVEILLKEYRPRRVIVFSRDEFKQHEMRNERPEFNDSEHLRYFIGNVRDLERLNRAFHGVDVVVHAAAMKQVAACEYNPFEAVLTNVIGAKNVIEAAIDQGVKRVLSLSTDKAVNPVNLYGATKLCAEKLFVQGNAYSSRASAWFSCVRYGNVLGSRGSVVPLFFKQRRDGCLTVTDGDMTRFWITLEQGVRFVIRCIEQMHGGEIFVPKIPSTKVIDLARAVAPGCEVRTIGVRPGEKFHEVLLSEDEARHSVEFDDMYVLRPEHQWWDGKNWDGGRTPPAGFRFSSDANPRTLSAEDLQALVRKFADGA